MSQTDYPQEIRTYTKRSCPFKSKDKRNYNHWVYYNITKPRLANKVKVV